MIHFGEAANYGEGQGSQDISIHGTSLSLVCFPSVLWTPFSHQSSYSGLGPLHVHSTSNGHSSESPGGWKEQQVEGIGSVGAARGSGLRTEDLRGTGPLGGEARARPRPGLQNGARRAEDRASD